jgi:hypothetical protein
MNLKIRMVLPFVLNILLVSNMVATTCAAENKTAIPATKPIGSATPVAKSVVDKTVETKPSELKSSERAVIKKIDSQDALAEWFSFYYQHPQPSQIIPALLYADKSGFLEKVSNRAIMASFLVALLPQNPTLLDELLTKLKPLSMDLRSLLVSVIWMSNNEAAKAKVPMLISVLPESNQNKITNSMLVKWQPLIEQKVDTPEQLDMLWAAFSATGDDKYVERLLSVLQEGELASAQAMSASVSRGVASKVNLNRVLVFEAASWSITSNAKQHKKVLEICKRVAKSKGKDSAALQRVIEDAERKPAEKPKDKTGG